ncbi:MAG: class I SAM-dependent methyltransferase [Candidatus Krumholzibacteria bacterium]|nr:class I SAM-dependent methyltransferase [Candidatus Krumholzibacteria bacterium]
MKAIILKRGREKSLMRRHPWIFSGAIAGIEGHPRAGETVDILAAEGAILGRGAYSPRSQMTVRVWSFDPQEEITSAFFADRLSRAAEARGALAAGEGPPGVRLVNAESDGLPGIIVDRYGEYLVAQFLTTGAEYWKATVVEELVRLDGISGVYERSDADVREKEGLPKLAGVLAGAEPPDLVEIREGPCRFLVDVKRGHKTGFYLDQRENRAAIAEFARGAVMLNCFSYTGGFGIAALAAGAASATNVDSSAPALALARRNAELNGIDEALLENVEGDAFTVMRRWRDEGRMFDVIVLDPPKFAESKANLSRASRGYKDINLLAFRLLGPGGILFTFSCSGLMSAELFQKIVSDAALDAGCEAQIIRRLAQASDHPTLLSFPESSYLKGFICRVMR